MKKILSLIIAIMMLSSVSAFAVEVSYPANLVVDDFDSYTEGQVIPFGGTGDKWDDYADRGFDDSWQPLGGVDPENEENGVLRVELKPSSGSTRSLLTACEDASGVITISFDIYVPYGEVIEGTDTLYNDTQERTNFVTFSASSAESATEVLNARLWLNRVANGADYPKFDISGAYYNLPGYNVWCPVKFVIDTNNRTTEYYLTGQDTPDVTKAISTNNALDFFRIYAATGINNSLFYIDNFDMTYNVTETIDENSIALTYDAPAFNLAEGTVTVNGSVTPYFAQTAGATIYMEDDNPENYPLTENTTTVAADGSFSVVLHIPDTVRGWAKVVVSTDHIQTPEEERTSRIFITTPDDEENMLIAFNAIVSEDNPDTDEDETLTVTQTLDDYLPMAVSEAEFQLYENNKDFFKDYFMARAAEETSYADVNAITGAFRSACAVKDIKEAAPEEIIDKLDKAEYIEKDDLSEDLQAEYIRIWAEYEDAIRCESDINTRIEKIHAVASVNCARRSEIAGILGTFKDVFGLTEEELAPEDVDVDLVCSALNGQEYNFPKEVKEAYLASLEEKLEEENSSSGSSGSSGGGSGGGSFGGSKGGGSAVSASPEIVEENLPKVEPEENAVIPEEETPKAPEFTDTENHWAKSFVEELSAKKIINGYEDGTFKPDNAVTRAEFVTMVVRLLGLEEADADFADVNENDWFYSYVGAAHKNGLISGNGEGFSPYDLITRQDAAVILYHAMGIKEGKTAEFSDADSISSYAEDAVNALSSLGIINGYEDNSFRPLNPITRGETAKILSYSQNR